MTINVYFHIVGEENKQIGLKIGFQNLLPLPGFGRRPRGSVAIHQFSLGLSCQRYQEGESESEIINITHMETINSERSKLR